MSGRGGHPRPAHAHVHVHGHGHGRSGSHDDGGRACSTTRCYHCAETVVRLYARLLASLASVPSALKVMVEGGVVKELMACNTRSVHESFTRCLSLWGV